MEVLKCPLSIINRYIWASKRLHESTEFISIKDTPDLLGLDLNNNVLLELSTGTIRSEHRLGTSRPLSGEISGQPAP